MEYLIISLIIFIISIIFIWVFNRKMPKLKDSVYFSFISGIIATFIGFTLSMYAVEVQKNQDDKNTAKSLIETSIYTNKTEVSLIGVRVMFLQDYLNGKIKEPMLYSLSIENNTLDLFIDNGDQYAIFSDEFKKNLPMVNQYINQFCKQYENSMKENNIDTLRALKFIAAEKYLYSLLLENELKYLEKSIDLEEHNAIIKNIMKNKEDELLGKVLKDDNIQNIIPAEFYQK